MEIYLGQLTGIAPEHADSLEFLGGELFIPGRASAIASYAGGWIYGGKRVPFIHCRGIFLAQLEDTSGKVGLVVGPRSSLMVRDRHAFVGREPFATFSPRIGRWVHPKAREGWAVMRITEKSREDAGRPP